MRQMFQLDSNGYVFVPLPRMERYINDEPECHFGNIP